MRPQPTDSISVPAHSVEAEQAVLGGLMLDAAAIHQVPQLRGVEFYRNDHRLIFRVIKRLSDNQRPVDVVTVAEALEASGDLDRVGGLAYVAMLAENTPSAANIAAYADIVAGRARLRFLKAALADGLADVSAPNGRTAADICANVQSRLEAIASSNAASTMTLADVLSSGLTAAKLAADRRRKGGVVGVPTGLPAIDARTGGLHGPRLWIVAGRPSLGKTALTLQWALHAAQRDAAVGIVSLEMGSDEMAARAIANRFGVNAAALAHGEADEFDRLKQLVGEDRFARLRGQRILFDFDTTVLSGIVSRITEWRRVNKIDFAIVDHAGLIEADGFTNRNDQLGFVSRTFKKLTKRLEMPIILVSQLNRNVEKEKRQPTLSDLRDSGNLEQDADVVLMLHSEADDGSDIELGLLKNRAGVRGWIPARFTFSGQTQQFRELATAGRYE